MVEVQKILTCVSIDGTNPCVEAVRERVELTSKASGFDQQVDSHGLFVLDGPHPRINVLVFEFGDGLPMNFKVDGLPVLRVIGVVNPFVGCSDPPVVGLKDRVFEEKTQCGYLGNHHTSGAVHLVSEVGVWRWK